MEITPAALKSVSVGRTFKDNTGAINALDFSDNGSLLVTSSDDESIHLYNTDAGSLKKTIFSKRYGASCIRFTHHHNSVIVASKNGSYDETIRYLSLHDNCYLRYFKGHRNRVVSLEMSPTDDTFLSGSLDNSVRLWDLRSPNCQGVLRIGGRPAVGYDPSGLVFGIATSFHGLRLFDSRNAEKGSFGTFPLDSIGDVTAVKFSPDGKYVALAGTKPRLLLLDAFDGKMVHALEGHQNDSGLSLEPSFSADGQYVLSGSEDGLVHCWDTASGQRVANWKHSASSPAAIVKFSPSRFLFASACSKLQLWVPEQLTAAISKRDEAKSDA